MHHLKIRQAFSLMCLFLLAVLAGCSGSASSTGTTTGTSTTAVVAKLLVASSVPSVKTDSSDSATITATALDANNVAVPGATVVFKSNSGALVVASAKTDASGKATATYSAGSDQTNRIEVITVTADGVLATTQVKVAGSTLVLQTPSSTALIGGSSMTLQYKVADAAGTPIANATIDLSVSGTGSITLASNPITTSADGSASVVITGASAGDATIKADGVGATVSQKFTVPTTANAFSAAPSKTTALLGETITVVAQAPNANTVIFASTFGAWNGGAASTVQIPVSGGAASATFTTSSAGVVSFSVYDKADTTRRSSFNVTYSPDVSAVAKVVLQASPSVVAPSIGGVQNTATVTATVTDATGHRIANAPVAFTIQNPTSGGESFSNIIAYTGDGLNGSTLGVATTSFIAGVLPSGQSSSAINIVGAVNGVNSVPLPITIAGGIAGSVTLGQASSMQSINSDTAYKLPMSVQVADAAGNPVASTTVTLSVWPLYWSTGTGCTIARTFKNEDVNENLLLDSGEDGVRVQVDNTTFAVTSNGTGTLDGLATPPNAAAGSIPKTVTTDANGVATFDYIYLKGNSMWTVVRMTATAVVQGTETKSQIVFRLMPLEPDVSPCHISNSPYIE